MLWAVTSYFNPCRYKRRLSNYRIFRRRLQAPLVAVELSFDGEFQLQPGDADVLIRLRGGDVMWQKERLLNVGIAALPGECDLVAWLDCDVIFENDGWPAAATEALRRYTTIQPFERGVDLAEEPGDGGPDPGRESVARAWTNGAARIDIVRVDDMQAIRLRPGLAWAARRELVARHGLYDACVLGSGDRAIVGAILGDPAAAARYLRMNPCREEHYLNWARPFHGAVQGSLGLCPGTIRHLWHGDRENRRYQSRHIDFAAFDFDPSRDIALDEHGCWRWNSDKPAMHRFVEDFFSSRMEDGAPSSSLAGDIP